jgi:hypothetical protein
MGGVGIDVWTRKNSGAPAQTFLYSSVMALHAAAGSAAAHAN